MTRVFCDGEQNDYRFDLEIKSGQIVSLIITISPCPAPEPGWVRLFNGKDLTGWVATTDKDPLPERAWEVLDDVLIVHGLPNVLASGIQKFVPFCPAT
jgi:hypothetical protein